MPSLRCVVAVVAVVSVVSAHPATAQTPSLAPVVVTAARSASAPRVPASVTVLSGDSLRARGISELADALRLVPGVHVVTSSSFGSQTTLFVRGGQGSYVRVLLDGVPLNEPGGAVDVGSLSLENIARIEVLRGPASVLYGQDAATGVIHLISRTEAGSRAAMTLDAGSYGRRDVAVSGAAGSDRASVNAALAERTSHGILPFNNAYQEYVASAAVQLRPDARTRFTIASRWQASTYHYPTESDGSIRDHNAESTAHRLLLSMTGTRILSERLTAAWSLTSGEHDPRSNDGPDSPADTVGFYGFFSRGTVTRRAADLRFTARAAGAHWLTAGAEIARDHERSFTRSLSQYGEDDGAFAAARQTRAIYTELAGPVLSHGTYQLGARLDDNSAFGTFRTVRAAAAWSMTANWRVRAAAGSAFRAPSFFENFAVGYVRGNAHLAPERTHSGEVGADGRVGRLRLAVVAYRQRFSDLIQYTAQPSTASSPNYYNVAGASADGAEVDASAPLAASMQARLMYAYTRTRVTNAGFDTGDGATFVQGQPLMRRPAHTARAELARTFGRRGEVTVGAAYTGSAKDRDFAAWPATPVTVRPRTLVDAAARVHLTSAAAVVPVALRLRGDNLTNAAYDGIYGYRAPGRTLSIGITIGRP